jgi:hypothetical protein
MAAMAANRRAQAADSTRAQAATAPAWWVPVVAATNSSNILSKLMTHGDERQKFDPRPVNKTGLCTTLRPRAQNVSAAC